MSQMTRANEPVPPPYQSRSPRSRLRRAIWAHALGSYAWMLCYAPALVEKMQTDSTLPMASKIAGGVVGLLLAPLIAPAIMLAAPVAAVVQDRTLLITYLVALPVYLVCAIATFLRGNKPRPRV